MPPRSRITIRDVAAQAGVPVATVPKGLNQRYGAGTGFELVVNSAGGRTGDSKMPDDLSARPPAARTSRSARP